MPTRTASIALATALGLGGVTTVLVLAPALASAATSQATTPEAVGDRMTRIKGALSGLVTDGTITQAQSDKVATTLDKSLPKAGGPGGPRGRRHGLETAATTLGVTREQLRTALQAGQSLADVAQSRGVAKQTLVAALVAEAKARLAERVTAGQLTQAQADTRLTEVTTKITEQVDRKGSPARPGRGDTPPPPAAAD